MTHCCIFWDFVNFAKILRAAFLKISICKMCFPKVYVQKSCLYIFVWKKLLVRNPYSISPTFREQLFCHFLHQKKLKGKLQVQIVVCHVHCIRHTTQMLVKLKRSKSTHLFVFEFDFIHCLWWFLQTTYLTERLLATACKYMQDREFWLMGVLKME